MVVVVVVVVGTELGNCRSSHEYEYRGSSCEGIECIECIV